MSQPDMPAQGTGAACRWCGASLPGNALSCPACGAPVDQVPRATFAGWTELPPMRDLTRIRLGQSTCQIEGDVTPVADVNLAVEDGLYFVHHALLWREPTVASGLMPIGSGLKRFIAGMPVYMMQAQGPGRIAFSGLSAGELFAVPLAPGESIYAREHTLLVAHSSVRYDFIETGLWYRTTQNNEVYFPVGQFIDRFTATDRPGVVLLHCAGDVFIRDLARGEHLLIQPGAFVYRSPTVDMTLYREDPAQSGMTSLLSGYHPFIFLSLTGPGRVAVRSVFDQLPPPSGN